MSRFLRFSFSVKLTLALLIAGLVPASYTAFQDQQRLKEASEESALGAVESMLAMKHYAVGAYIDSTISLMVTIAETPTAVNGIRNMAQAVDLSLAMPGNEIDAVSLKQVYQQQVEQTKGQTASDAETYYNDLDEAARMLQSAFISKNPNTAAERYKLVDAQSGIRYNSAHIRFHNEFVKFQQRYGFNDLKLVDARDARVVYSVAKKTDFGTSFRSGPYRDTGLAKTVVSMLQGGGTQSVMLQDFESYPASLGAQSAFILIPVKENETVLGLLIAELPEGFADHVLNHAKTDYKTEDAYISGNDMLVRSVPLRTSGFHVGDYFPDYLEGKDDAHTGQIVETSSYDGLFVLLAIKDFDYPGLDWHLVVEIGHDEIMAASDAAIESAKMRMMVIAAIIIVLGAVVAKILVFPIRKLGAEVEQQASSVVKSLKSAAGTARAAAEGMSSNAEETNRQTQVATQHSRATADTVSAVAAAAEELSGSIGEVVSGIRRTAELVEAASSRANHAASQLTELERVAGRITGMVELINDIANRTNLLALNAAVEASHAGEAGRGFAVVADEIRRLAARTTASTTEIAGEVRTVLNTVASNADAIRAISVAINEVSDQSSRISSSAEQQGVVTGEIASRMSATVTRVKDVDSTISGVQGASGHAASAAIEVVNMMERVEAAAGKMADAMQNFVYRVRTL